MAQGLDWMALNSRLLEYRWRCQLLRLCYCGRNYDYCAWVKKAGGLAAEWLFLELLLEWGDDRNSVRWTTLARRMCVLSSAARCSHTGFLSRSANNFFNRSHSDSVFPATDPSPNFFYALRQTSVDDVRSLITALFLLDRKSLDPQKSSGVFREGQPFSHFRPYQRI